jgi:hypothetical protein
MPMPGRVRRCSVACELGLRVRMKVQRSRNRRWTERKKDGELETTGGKSF